MFADNASQKGAKEDQEDSSSKWLSREDMEESLKTTTWKMPRDDASVAVEPPKRNLSQEELDICMESHPMMCVKEEPGENVMEFTPRKTGWETMETPPDAPARKVTEERADCSMDTHFGMLPKVEQEDMCDSLKNVTFRDRKDFVGDVAYRKISREELDVGMDTQRAKISRKSSRDELDNYSDTHFGKMFRETDISLDAASRKPPRDDSDFGTSAQRRRIFRDKRDLSLDAAPRKISRDEFDIAPEERSQRRRTIRDFRMDNSIDTPTGKIPWDRLDYQVDPRRISREEHAAMEAARFGQPDITSSTLMMWNPQGDPISMLVYDGILEKAYPMAMTAPTPGDFPGSMHELQQGMVGLETSSTNLTPHCSPNASPPENRSSGKEKTKKSSKLKSLFQKKKKDTSSSPPDGTQGSLQKM